MIIRSPPPAPVGEEGLETVFPSPPPVQAVSNSATVSAADTSLSLTVLPTVSLLQQVPPAKGMKDNDMVVWSFQIASLPGAPSGRQSVIALKDGLIPELWRECPAKGLAVTR
jgi:hypothetical protein